MRLGARNTRTAGFLTDCGFDFQMVGGGRAGSSGAARAAEGGRLVLPLGPAEGQRLAVVDKGAEDGRVRVRELIPVLFSRLETVVTPVGDGGEALPPRADPALVKALARAFRYQRLLDEGRYASISEMSAEERIERGYLGTLLRLTLLAPDLVEAILDGRQPADLGLPRLLGAVPADWSGQPQALLGIGAVG